MGGVTTRIQTVESTRFRGVVNKYGVYFGSRRMKFVYSRAIEEKLREILLKTSC
jgi:hypothetical protein